MSEHNFDSFKNFEVPDSWVEGALNVPPDTLKNERLSYLKPLLIAASVVLVLAISASVFLINKSIRPDKQNDNTQPSSITDNSEEHPDLSPSNSDLFCPPVSSTQDSTFSEEPTSFSNTCVGIFSQDLVLGNGNIYCVIYDYKTGKQFGDENLFDTEHLATIEYQDDGTVKASYNPVDKGVVKKSGEYWYAFYNELVMSPVQNYIYIRVE